MTKQAKTIMLQGTASDAGKSVLTTALCKILTEDGFRTAPFKSQNMSLNSYVTWNGLEIGRAQGLQAEACKILATTDMNPILLKPKQDMVSQVIVHGKPLGDYAAKVYREQILAEAGTIVKQALGRLRSEYDVVVLEGAGSPAEINLKDRDIVNMRAAEWAEAPVILVADIDRGGMFASIIGTLELLEPEERERICGFIVNKFRGDVSLLQPGLDWLEQRTGKPVLGVIPFLPELRLEDEDSLSLDAKINRRDSARSFQPEPGLALEPEPESGLALEPESESEQCLDIAVIRFPHISNFTDIDPLSHEPDVKIRYLTLREQWGEPDAVILPGSKNTIDDLIFLRESGLMQRLQHFKAQGGRVFGICGGYEMMGRRLLDPELTESSIAVLEGLGWFPYEVRFQAEKRTVRVQGKARLPGMEQHWDIEGYEIHTGTVHWQESALSAYRAAPVALKQPLIGAAEAGEGCSTADGKVWGTFIHGMMDNDAFRRAWINLLRQDKGWAPLPVRLRLKEQKERELLRLEAHVRKYADIERIKRIIGLEAEKRGDHSI